MKCAANWCYLQLEKRRTSLLTVQMQSHISNTLLNSREVAQQRRSLCSAERGPPTVAKLHANLRFSESDIHEMRLNLCLPNIIHLARLNGKCRLVCVQNLILEGPLLRLFTAGGAQRRFKLSLAGCAYYAARTFRSNAFATQKSCHQLSLSLQRFYT